MLTKGQADHAILRIARILNDLNLTPEEGLDILYRALLAHPLVMGIEVTTVKDVEALVDQALGDQKTKKDQ